MGNLKTTCREYIGVLVFTLIYLIPFTIYFLSTGNAEFIWYVAIVVLLFILVFSTMHKSHLTHPITWLLSIWAMLHLAVGSIQVGGGTLYSLQLLPIYNGGGEFIILKFDQALHAYGFAVATLLVFHFLRRWIENPYRLSVYPVAILAGMGLGVVNEIAEFGAVLLFENTGVGGYINTSLDLVFNTLGAILAMVMVHIFHKGR